jgi:hypothetical protein
LLDLLFHFLSKGLIIVLMIAIFIVSYLNLIKSNKKYEYNKNNVCFICNIHRDVFLRNKLCFDKHTRKIHNKFDYINYIIFLVTRKRSNLNRMDKFVLEKFIIGDLFWIPCGKTSSIQQKIKK